MTNAISTDEDTELVRRFNAGDESAFDEIVSRHRTRIHATILSYVHDHYDAEELVQDTFVRAYRGLASFRGDSSFSTWIHRIAVNTARNRYWYFHRRCRHLQVSLDAPLGEDGTGSLGDVLASTQENDDGIRTRNDFVKVVGECMDNLGYSDRTILSLRAVKDLSYEEIGRELGLNVGTVKSRIARARERLRAAICGACPEFIGPTGEFQLQAQAVLA
jgi:RNA polymerase sigma-70 factor (ECF subfamily)